MGFNTPLPVPDSAWGGGGGTSQLTHRFYVLLGDRCAFEVDIVVNTPGKAVLGLASRSLFNTVQPMCGPRMSSVLLPKLLFFQW